jgi:hypothetical protein
MLKRIVWTFGLLLFAVSAIAQTREETEAWILQQGNMNTPLLRYYIERGELVSEASFGPGAGSMGARPVQKAIPIGRITHITYVRTDKYLSYSLMCDTPCSYLLDEPDEKPPKFLFEIYRKLDASFPARMNKALLHLIRLHGGSATIVKQGASKEAF